MWGLDPRPVASGDALLAAPVAASVDAGAAGAPAERIRVAKIDPAYADTADLRDTYGVPMDASVNCVVVTAKRAGQTRMAACLVRASTRADVNGVVRRHLGARKASFAPQDKVVAATGMEYGGITPIGLPEDWPILVDSAVLDCPDAVVGSGVRGSKLILPGAALAELPGAEVVEGLGVPAG